jgi:hypothetical protein
MLAFPTGTAGTPHAGGLGSDLNRSDVDDSVIQRILRHSNISTTQAYYIKTAADDAQDAMSKLENNIPQPAPSLTDTYGTLKSRGEATDRTIQKNCQDM